MKLVVNRARNRTEKYFERIAGQEGQMIQREDIGHHMLVHEVGKDEKIAVPAAEGDPAWSESCLRSRVPVLPELPDDSVGSLRAYDREMEVGRQLEHDEWKAKKRIQNIKKNKTTVIFRMDRAARWFYG